MDWSTIAVPLAFFGGMYLSFQTMKHMSPGTRVSEWGDNERSEPLSPQQLQWQIVHIRDDLASITGLMAYIMGFLAAILAALVIR